MFSVYPNPVIYTLVITHGKARAGAICKLYLTDGKQVFTQAIKQNKTQTLIEVSRLAYGSYQLTMLNGLEKTIAVIIKQYFYLNLKALSL